MDKMIFLLGSLVYSLILKHIFVSFVTQVVGILSALSAAGITSAARGQAAVVTKYQSSVQYRVDSGQYRVDRVSSTGCWSSAAVAVVASPPWEYSAGCTGPGLSSGQSLVSAPPGHISPTSDGGIHEHALTVAIHREYCTL